MSRSGRTWRLNKCGPGYHRDSYYVVVAIESDEGYTGDSAEATVQALWSGRNAAERLSRDSRDYCPSVNRSGSNARYCTCGYDGTVSCSPLNSFTKAAVEMALLDLAR